MERIKYEKSGGNRGWYKVSFPNNKDFNKVKTFLDEWPDTGRYMYYCMSRTGYHVLYIEPSEGLAAYRLMH